MYTNVPCKVFRSHRGLRQRFRRPAMLYIAAKYLYTMYVYIYIYFHRQKDHQSVGRGGGVSCNLPHKLNLI